MGERVQTLSGTAVHEIDAEVGRTGACDMYVKCRSKRSKEAVSCWCCVKMTEDEHTQPWHLHCANPFKLRNRSHAELVNKSPNRYASEISLAVGSPIAAGPKQG